MPKRLELTWVKPTRRWRKRYKGRDYFFPFGSSKSDQQGYAKALAAWQAKKAEIDADSDDSKPYRVEYHRAINSRSMMRDWHQQQGDQQAATRLAGEIADLQDRLASKSPPPLDPWEIDPLWGDSEKGRAVWADRFEQLQTNLDPDRTVSGNTKAFLQNKQNLVRAGERSHAQYDLLRCCLEHFQKWHGGDRAIETINAKALIAYHAQLMADVQQGGKGNSRHYAKQRMASLKQFIRWLWSLELIELPRNITSPDLKVSLPANGVQTLNIDEFKTLLRHASETTKLYLLLMLNCGMTQQDIADLRHTEVDWKVGRLFRKRSKTDRHENVPIVDYKLWKTTFDLLKKNRSGHPDLVLTNQQGEPLKVERFKGDKIAKKDAIRSAYNRVARKAGVAKPLKLIRKTGASKIGEHADYGRLAPYYLGHASKTIADRHYVKLPQKLFDDAIIWLGRQFNLA